MQSPILWGKWKERCFSPPLIILKTQGGDSMMLNRQQIQERGKKAPLHTKCPIHLGNLLPQDVTMATTLAVHKRGTRLIQEEGRHQLLQPQLLNRTSMFRGTVPQNTSCLRSTTRGGFGFHRHLVAHNEPYTLHGLLSIPVLPGILPPLPPVHQRAEPAPAPTGRHLCFFPCPFINETTHLISAQKASGKLL